MLFCRQFQCLSIVIMPLPRYPGGIHWNQAPFHSNSFTFRAPNNQTKCCQQLFNSPTATLALHRGIFNNGSIAPDELALVRNSARFRDYATGLASANGSTAINFFISFNQLPDHPILCFSRHDCCSQWFSVRRRRRGLSFRSENKRGRNQRSFVMIEMLCLWAKFTRFLFVHRSCSLPNSTPYVHSNGSNPIHEHQPFLL
jgi:hypothetical protein